MEGDGGGSAGDSGDRRGGGGLQDTVVTVHSRKGHGYREQARMRSRQISQIIKQKC